MQTHSVTHVKHCKCGTVMVTEGIHNDKVHFFYIVQLPHLKTSLLVFCICIYDNSSTIYSTSGSNQWQCLYRTVYRTSGLAGQTSVKCFWLLIAPLSFCSTTMCYVCHLNCRIFNSLTKFNSPYSIFSWPSISKEPCFLSGNGFLSLRWCQKAT